MLDEDIYVGVVAGEAGTEQQITVERAQVLLDETGRLQLQAVEVDTGGEWFGQVGAQYPGDLGFAGADPFEQSIVWSRRLHGHSGPN